ESRRRAPAAALDRRHGPDPEAEVVAGAPVGEVVPRAEVARLFATEVRGLVPAVASRGQPRDDAFEVRLHLLGLARELRPVRVGEARARLRLELVAGEVLRLQCEGRREIGLQIGGALARDAIDQV